MGKAVTLLMVLALAMSYLPAIVDANVFAQAVVRAASHAGSIGQRQAQSQFYGNCSAAQFGNILVTSGFSTYCYQNYIGTTDICEPRCGQPQLDAYCKCRSEQGIESFTTLCSINAQGQRCAHNEVIVPLSASVVNALSPCGLPRSTPETNCSPACKTALEAVRDIGGCCVNNNILNSVIPLYGIDDALWASCGIVIPEFCQLEGLLGCNSVTTSSNSPATTSAAGALYAVTCITAIALGIII